MTLFFLYRIPQAWNENMFDLTMDDVLYNDFQQASRYLGIDIIGSPSYVKLRNEIYSGNILYPVMTLDVFKDALSFCFQNNANKLGQYLIQNTKVTC